MILGGSPLLTGSVGGTDDFTGLTGTLTVAGTDSFDVWFFVVVVTLGPKVFVTVCFVSGADGGTFSTPMVTVGASDVTEVVPEAIDSVSDGENADVIGAGGSTLSDMRGTELADDNDVKPSDEEIKPFPSEVGPKDAIVHRGEDEGVKDASADGCSG